MRRDRKRDRLLNGVTIELENSPDRDVGKLVPGKEYWLAITPPNAHKALPREAGTGDHTTIVFAVPVNPRRAK